MKRREPLPGFKKADWELHGAIIHATVETRVLLHCL